jgi:hypothetical protein
MTYNKDTYAKELITGKDVALVVASKTVGPVASQLSKADTVAGINSVGRIMSRKTCSNIGERLDILYHNTGVNIPCTKSHYWEEMPKSIKFVVVCAHKTRRRYKLANALQASGIGVDYCSWPERTSRQAYELASPAKAPTTGLSAFLDILQHAPKTLSVYGMYHNTFETLPGYLRKSQPQRHNFLQEAEIVLQEAQSNYDIVRVDEDFGKLSPKWDTYKVNRSLT